MIINKITKICLKVLPKYIRKELKVYKLISIDYGHLNSVKQSKSVDKDGNFLPWYTYPSIEFISELNLHGKTVFEWGSGYSSIFWSQKAKSVISIEDNAEWFKKINLIKKRNNDILLKPKKLEYIRIIAHFQTKFDIIIIDGKYRKRCAEVSVNYLNEGGLIILDNSDRYPEICKKLSESGLKQINFTGFGPINSYVWTTSLFFSKESNFLRIKPEAQKLFIKKVY
jgi:hypothetical protein